MAVTTISIDVPDDQIETFRDDLNKTAALMGTTSSKLAYEGIFTYWAEEIHRARQAASFFKSSETQKPQSKRARRTPESAR